MKWALGGLVLLVLGILLRRLLRLGAKASTPVRGLVPLEPQLQGIYQPIALEIETQAAILGISLNDAFEERDAGRDDTAWRLVALSAGEWERLARIVVSLLKVVAKHLPSSRGIVLVRGIVAHRFKSELMTDFIRMHEFLDQLVFVSALRFQLHVRVLRRAAETLTAEFRRACRSAELSAGCPEELWRLMDLYFHDIDLVTKEALLTFRALLASLPQSALPDLLADLSEVVQHGVRSLPVLVDQ